MSKLRSYSLLAILVLICAALVLFASSKLSAGIEQQKRQQFERQLLSFLAVPVDQHIRLEALSPPKNGWPEPINNQQPIYQVWRQDQLFAVLLPVTAQGFRGPIQLRVALSPSGQLLGSQVLAEQETPGLGGQIRDSDWLAQFTRSPKIEDWKLRSLGGQIDQISGATITSKSVSQLLEDSVLFYNKHRLTLERRP